MSIFDEVESEVRSYCRAFPVIFDKAEGSYLYDEDGNEYLDFFAGAGTLNYGHNNPYIMERVIEYLKNKGITHALDMSTHAKKEFLLTFDSKLLKPKGYNYKVMFCGSTGTNAVEAALKLARKVTGRETVFAFSGSFHGMTAGSLSVSSNTFYRKDLTGVHGSTVFMPFPYGFNKSFDTIGYIRNVLSDDHSGIALPAAIIVETIQSEGGIVVAEAEWLKQLRQLCDEYGILLICDDIQIGCGRTGSFFSFERADIQPDMVTLSKSVSGAGFPMSLLLIKPQYDKFAPGEHNGTFRGNQVAFVAGAAALEYALQTGLYEQARTKGAFIEQQLKARILPIDERISYRGLGMIYGIDFSAFPQGFSKKVSDNCFASKLVIERCGRFGSVLKLLPPLTTSEEQLECGIKVIENAVIKALDDLK